MTSRRQRFVLGFDQRALEPCCTDLREGGGAVKVCPQQREEKLTFTGECYNFGRLVKKRNIALCWNGMTLFFPFFFFNRRTSMNTMATRFLMWFTLTSSLFFVGSCVLAEKKGKSWRSYRAGTWLLRQRKLETVLSGRRFHKSQ